MPNNNSTVFSEFEARLMNIIFGEGDVYAIKCVGKVECEAAIQNVVKKCRGRVAKKRTRATGEGTLKVTAHMPYECYIRLHDMERDELVDGVHAYGQNSLHPEVCVTADIFDEDDNEKLKAWPRCTISTGANSSIENGGEEVAEVELEIGYMPDDYNEGFYEALADEVDEAVAIAWLNAFSPDLVRKNSTPAQQPDCTLRSLAIGSLELIPAFDGAVTAYTAATNNATNVITAVANDSDATVTIKNGSTDITSGSSATWEDGDNTVTVKVANGGREKTYTVTVTKS